MTKNNGFFQWIESGSQALDLEMQDSLRDPDEVEQEEAARELDDALNLRFAASASACTRSTCGRRPITTSRSRVITSPVDSSSRGWCAGAGGTGAPSGSVAGVCSRSASRSTAATVCPS